MDRDNLISAAALLCLGIVAIGPADAQSPPVNLTIGAGATLTQSSGGTVYHGGTATLTAGGTTTPGVQTIVVGNCLTGGTITNAGTIAGTTLPAGEIAGNAGTVAACPQGVAIGANLTLSAAGTLSASAPGTGTVTQVVAADCGGGTITNAGTVTCHHQGTVTCNGLTTITPALGTDNVLINVGTTATCTLSVAGELFPGEGLRLQIHQGATAEIVTFDTTTVFGTTVASFTASTTPGDTDLVQEIGVNASRWAIVAISNGFSF